MTDRPSSCPEHPEITGENPSFTEAELAALRDRTTPNPPTNTNGTAIEDVAAISRKLLAANISSGEVAITDNNDPADATTEEPVPASFRPDPRLTNRPPNQEDLRDIHAAIAGMKRAKVPKEALELVPSSTPQGDEPTSIPEVQAKQAFCVEGDQE